MSDSSFVAKIDWLAFTFKAETLEPNSVEQYKAFWHFFPELTSLYNKGIEITHKGANGDRFYNNVLCFNDFMRVAYRDIPFDCVDKYQRNMGVNVSVPAHGLEYFISLFAQTFKDKKIEGKNDIQKLLILLHSRGCSISRLDIAFDDYEKTFKPFDWEGFRISDRLVTNFKSFKYIASGRQVNDTFYVGKRSAGKLLRIYDKNGESHGVIDAIRYEFEFHGKYCEDYAKFIRNNGYLPDFPSIFSRFINRVIDENSKCQNKSMAKIDSKFADFIESAKLSFCEQLEYTKFADSEDRLKKSTRWIATQIMPSIKSFIRVYGESAFWLLYNNSDCHSLDDKFRSNFRLHQEEYIDFLSQYLPHDYDPEFYICSV